MERELTACQLELSAWLDDPGAGAGWLGRGIAEGSRADSDRCMTCVDEELELVTIKTISTREVYRNPWTSVREDVIERANGQRGIYGVIDKDPACIIVPLEETVEGRFVYLVEQYRYTVQGRFMEFPQGGWETADVDPEALARGELKEETGLSAGRMTHLIDLQIAYGVMNQKHHVFLAEDLRAGLTEPDAEETDLVLHRVRVEEFEEMLLDGRIVDNCTAAAWGVYRLWRERRGVDGMKVDLL